MTPVRNAVVQNSVIRVIILESDGGKTHVVMHCTMYMPCCLCDLACFFLPSFSSLIKTCILHSVNYDFIFILM